MANILITGGRGGIGLRLSDYFTRNGHEVRILTRSDSQHNKHLYHWNPKSGEIDLAAFNQIDGIIHLAGEPVLGKRWTSKQKLRLRTSRLDGIACLFKTLEQLNIRLKFFAGASAVGYYGLQSSTAVKSEQDSAGSDFLSQLCVDWELAYKPITPYCERLFIFRIGIVLDDRAGMLKALWPVYRFGMGVQISNGKAIYPWIHYTDLCRSMHWIVNSFKHSGIFNLTAPVSHTQGEFHEALKHISKIPHLLPAVPKWLIKLLLGESSQMLTEGRPVSPKALLEAGFTFEYKELDIALKSLLNRL